MKSSIASRRRQFLIRAVAGLVLCWGYTALSEEQNCTLNVTVEGLRSDKGAVLLRLYDGAKGFPMKEARASLGRTVSIEGGVASVEIGGLPPGEYALAVVHDEDGDGKLLANWIGMPKEGVGTSNNPKPRFGPPKWKHAKFSVADQSLRVRIWIRYL